MAGCNPCRFISTKDGLEGLRFEQMKQGGEAGPERPKLSNDASRGRSDLDRH